MLACLGFMTNLRPQCRTLQQHAMHGDRMTPFMCFLANKIMLECGP